MTEAGRVEEIIADGRRTLGRLADGGFHGDAAAVSDLIDTLTTQAETIRRLEGEREREGAALVAAAEFHEHLKQRAEAAEERERALEAAARETLEEIEYWGLDAAGWQRVSKSLGEALA